MLRNRVIKGIVKAAVAVAVLAAAAAVVVALHVPAFIAGLPTFELAGAAASGAFSVFKGVQVYRKLRHQVKEVRDQIEAEGKPLTAGENAFAQGVFGKKMPAGELDRVRKVSVPEEAVEPEYEGPKAVTLGKFSTILFLGSDTRDYSRPENSAAYGIYIHEMTRLWQEQRLLHIFHKAADLVKRRNGNEEYTLSPKSRFNKFSMDQQAAIMEDYARYFLHPSASSIGIKNTPANNALLKKVVEKKFPEARKTRICLEMQG